MATSSPAQSLFDESRLSAREKGVLGALQHLFLEEGFRGLRIADIAARLRCSRRTLYSLASSKEELFMLVVERVLRDIDAEGRAAAKEIADAGGSVRDRLAALIEPGVTLLTEARPPFFSDVEGYAPARKRLIDHQSSRSAQMAALLDEGVATGEIRPVNTTVAAEMMIAGYRRIVEPAFLTTVDISLEQAQRESEDILFSGLFVPEK